MEKELKKFDVVLVNFGNENIGSEQGGIRPAVVVQNDIGNYFSTTTIVIPLSTQIKHIHQPTHTIIDKGDTKGLTESSLLLGEAVRQISKERIIKPLGIVTDSNEQNEIKRVYEANFGA